MRARERQRTAPVLAGLRGTFNILSLSDTDDFRVGRYVGTMGSMRMPWARTMSTQLELLAAEPGAVGSAVPQVGDVLPSVQTSSSSVGVRSSRTTPAAKANAGQPLLVPVSRLIEDPANPRTEFPDAEIEELAEDIRQRGILQPLVVHPAQHDGRHQIHFGARRLRAAVRAGLGEVPVVVRSVHADQYAQVAENQKRHGLSPLDIARFIRSQVDAGESNATVARRLGMSLTTVAHHLSLLSLPPVLHGALKSGRCTSPRTLHELTKLHAGSPGQVQALLASEAAITRAAVSAIRLAADEAAPSKPAASSLTKLIAQADAACDRLERALGRIKMPDTTSAAAPDLIALRSRVEAVATRWLLGSDRQTPSQVKP